MILWTLLSVVLYMMLAIFVTFCSGGVVGMLFWSYWNLMPWFMIACEILLAVCFGFAKDMLFPFFTKKRIEKCTLSELKNADLFFDFAIKLTVTLSLFIIVVSAIPFMYSWMDDGNQQLVGYNLATVIEGPLYGAFFILILLPLKSRVKNRQIDFMFESDDVENIDKVEVTNGVIGMEKKQNSKAKPVSAIFRVAFLVLWASVSIYVLLKSFILLDEKIGIPFDMPAIIYLVFAVFASLLVGGQLKNFGNAIASLFSDKKISVVQNEKNIESISLVLQTSLALGIFATLTGFYCMLKYLEEMDSFAPCFYVAMIPVLYAAFFAIVLECMIASLKKKNL